MLSTLFNPRCGLTTDDVLQIKDGSNWKDVSDKETLTNGTYRLRYLFNNKDAYIEVSLK